MRLTLIFLMGLFFSVDILAKDLKAAISAAEALDPALAQSKAMLAAGQEYEPLARSRLLPQVSVSGTYQNVDQSRESETTQGPSVQNYVVRATNSQLTLRQALFRRKEWVGVGIGRLQTEHSAFELASAYSILWQKVINAWLDVLSSQELVKNYKKVEVSARSAAEQATQTYVKGLITKQSMLEIHAQYELLKANSRDAQLNLQSRTRVLKNLTGIRDLDLSTLDLPRFDLIKFPFSNLDSLLGKSLELSPEVNALRIAHDIRRLQVQQSRAEHMPTLDLIGSLSRSENDNINLIGTRVNSQSIGVQLVIPIFSGGGVNAAVRQSGAIANAAEAELNSFRLKLQNQIDLDWTIYTSAIKKVEANRAAMLAAEVEVLASQSGMRSGLKSWSDIGVAHLVWSRRQVDYVESVVAGVRAQLRLMATLPISDDAWVTWLSQWR